jgi:uncharacterized protein (DUF3084 family)
MVRRIRFMGGLAVLAALGTAVPVFAAETSTASVRARVEDINVELAELSTHEYADEAAQELAQARLEVTDVQGLLSQGETAQAEVTLRRLEARKFLIEALLERATMEALAYQRESELIAIQQEADELQLELEAAQQRRNQLQDQVETIIAQMGGE